MGLAFAARRQVALFPLVDSLLLLYFSIGRRGERMDEEAELIVLFITRKDLLRIFTQE